MKKRESNEFESFVNSEEYQTPLLRDYGIYQFESVVNSEEYQTKNHRNREHLCLRALLIQKSIKLKTEAIR